MAYDSLKALIRQYIKTNGEQEITGQILQNVLVEMVNQYPSTDGFATQSWVTSQLAGYATTSQLADYLPLTGGTLTGTLELNNSSVQVVLSSKGKLLYTTSLDGYSININEYQNDGISIKSKSKLTNDELYFENQGVKGTSITYSSITSGSFIKSGGTSAQFLKADGSVDSNAYITSAALSGYATQSWVTTQLGSYLPLTGGTLTGTLELNNSSVQVVLSSKGKLLYTTSLDGYSININEYQNDGISIKSKSKLTNDELYFENQGVKGTSITYSSVTSGSFIKSGGTSAQFLKADGSVDSNAYITSATLADYLPLTGGTLTGTLELNNSSVQVVLSSKGKLLYTTSLDGYSININEYQNDGISIKSKSKLTNDELYFENQGVKGTSITYSSITSGSFIKSGGTSAQFLKADGSVDSNTYLPKQGNSFYFITDADMPETAANISTLNAAHRMTLYRNAILMPYQMNDANDGGFIRSRGTSESSSIFEIGMWDDAGAGETIQFNYYPTTSTINPTYSVTVPKKSGTIALTSDLASYNPTANFKTINNQSIIGTGNINIEGGGGGGAYYDAEIEYLESTGTQYIDTGLTLVNGTEKVSLVFDVIFTQFSSNSSYIAHSYPNSGVQVYTNESLIYNQTTKLNIATNTLYSIITVTTESVRNIRVDDRTASINFTRSITDSNPLYIIGSPNASANITCSYAKYRHFAILFNDVLVRDFIPVRVGNVGYLYDKVSGELFGNSGTGSFVLGQDTGPGGGLPYLPLTGGTISGNLRVNGKLTASGGYMDIYTAGGGNTTIFEFTDSQDVSFNGGFEYFFDAQISAPAFNNTSDLRKKTIIGDVPMNIYNVANAPLFKFTWNNEKKYSGQHIGTAAQYWQTVLPELVSIGRDADMTLAMQYDVIALASAITVAKTVVNHEERIILLERENEALKKEIADLKSA